MFNKRKKNLYVPDEDILAYNKAKQEAQNTADSETDTVKDNYIFDAPAEAPIQEPDALAVEPADNVAEDATVEAPIAFEPKLEVDTEVADENTNNVSDASVDGKKTSKLTKLVRLIVPMPKDGLKRIIIKCIAIVAALAIIISGTYLAFYFADLSQQDAKIENIRNNYNLNRDDYTLNDDNQFSKFDVLKSQNSDIIGWINIPDTEVDNPVYQTDNNDYYVTHDLDKKANSYGALFMDYRCRIDPKAVTQNQIIYGHNMRYGAMFGTLDEYRKIDYYKKHPVIYFDSLYEQRSYKIFAIMLVNAVEDSTFGYTYTAYRTDFVNDTDFLQWIDQSRQRSLIDTTVDVKADDEIITLSTCAYDYTDARLVILGRLVREGESTDVNTADAVTNKDVIYSKEYYKKKGLSIPKLTSSEASTASKSAASK